MADEEYPSEPSPAYDPGYAQTKSVQAYGGSALSLGDLRNPPVRRIVEQQIIELKAQLAERESFLKDLDAEPGVEKILDRMRKLHI